MAKKTEPEIHIVLSKDEGISCVQIVGPANTHQEGHDLYFKIIDLVQVFDKAIQARIKESKASAESSGH